MAKSIDIENINKRLAMLRVVEAESPYLTVDELQKYLGFGTRSMQLRWRDSRLLPYYLIGNRIIYKKTDVDRFVERHRIGVSKRYQTP